MGGIEPFTVETDHKPLLTILNTQDFCQCPPRLQGLKMRLVPFHYRVEFVRGKQLLVADALSRAPVETENDTISEEIEMHLNMVTIAGIPASDELFTELAEETEKDPELSRLMLYLLYIGVAENPPTSTPGSSSILGQPTFTLHGQRIRP